MLRFKRCIICYLGIIGSLMLLMNSVQAATLLDPANFEVGAKVGENLEVKSYCPDNKSSCLPEEKIKYITAMNDRVGQIEFDVNITDNFELDVNVYWYNYNSQTITLFKADDDYNGTLFITRGSSWLYFNDDLRYNDGSDIGWDRYKINNIELLAKNGIAYLNINRVPFKDYSGDEGDTVKLDTSKPFTKLAITNIKPGDKLYEITLKGGNSTTTPTTPTTPTVPTTPTTPVTTSSSSSDNCGIAKYTSTTGLFNVPCVAVPIVSAFSSAQIAVYSVQMQQQAGKFTFDLNLSSVKQRMMITILKQYLVGTQTCNDLRVDTFDDSGLIIASSENKTTCE